MLKLGLKAVEVRPARLLIPLNGSIKLLIVRMLVAPKNWAKMAGRKGPAVWLSYGQRGARKSGIRTVRSYGEELFFSTFAGSAR